MGKLPAFTGEKKMSDITMARSFVEEIGEYSTHRRGNLIDRVYDACSAYAERFRRAKPHANDDEVPSFTHRRIRSFWNREAAGVNYSEMVWLADVARQEKQLAERINQERAHHAQFISETLRMAALLQGADPDFMGGQGPNIGGGNS